MTWDAFHNRGETLRAVVDIADTRRDGLLPMQLPGVSENFHDELDLISALSLKWHTRLSGHLERELAAQPMDPEAAVARAWRRTADQTPGVRLILDRYTEFPLDARMGQALDRAERKEWVRLAVSAGLASDAGDRAAAVGQRIASRGRAASADLRIPAQRPAPEVETHVETTVPATIAATVPATVAATVSGPITPTSTEPAPELSLPGTAEPHSGSLVDRIKAALAA